MNAATRVNSPNVISRPVTSSMMPAYQTGQVPVGMPNAIGQSNNLDVPNMVKRNPNTMRNRLKTAGEYELRRESTLVVMGPLEHGSPVRTTRLPPGTDVVAEPAQRNRAFPSPSLHCVTTVSSRLQ